MDCATLSTLEHRGGLTSATPGLTVVAAGGGPCPWDPSGAGMGWTGSQSRPVGSDHSQALRVCLVPDTPHINISMVVFEIILQIHLKYPYYCETKITFNPDNILLKQCKMLLGPSTRPTIEHCVV